MARLESTDGKIAARTIAFPQITIEVALYVALAFCGFVARFFALGDAPLTSAEARQAMASWNFVNGNAGAFTGSPLLFTGNAILFALFGANDTIARLLPALFGGALVVLPALLRRELGRVGALVTSALFVFSPALVYFSRSLDGAVIAVTCALAALAFAWRFLTPALAVTAGASVGRGARDLNFAVVFTALAFLSARQVWTIALAIASFLLVSRFAFPSSVFKVGARQLAAANRNSAILLFAVFFFGIATTFTLRRDGIGAAFDLFGKWFEGLQSGSASFDPFRLLLVYDPIPLVLGVVGLMRQSFVKMDERGRTFFNALTFWLIVGLVGYSVGADKDPANVVVLAVPLAMLAGRYIGAWLEGAAQETDVEFFLSQEIPVFVFACVIGAFLYLIFAEFVTRGSLVTAAMIARMAGAERAADVTLDLQIISLLVVVALFAIAFLIVATVGWRRSPSLGLELVLTLFAVWTLRQTAMLNYADTLARNAREYLVTRAASSNLRDLERDLGDISRWRANDSTALTVLVDESINPFIEWTLRGFRNARVASRSSVTQDTHAVLLPVRAPAPAEGWMGQTYALETHRDPSASSSLLRGLLFRDVGALESVDVTLWIPQPK